MLYRLTGPRLIKQRFNLRKALGSMFRKLPAGGEHMLKVAYIAVDISVTAACQ